MFMIELGVWRLFKCPLLDKQNNLVSGKENTDDIQNTSFLKEMSPILSPISWMN